MLSLKDDQKEKNIHACPKAVPGACRLIGLHANCQRIRRKSLRWQLDSLVTRCEHDSSMSSLYKWTHWDECRLQPSEMHDELNDWQHRLRIQTKPRPSGHTDTAIYR